MSQVVTMHTQHACMKMIAAVLSKTCMVMVCMAIVTSIVAIYIAAIGCTSGDPIHTIYAAPCQVMIVTAIIPLSLYHT